MTKIQEDDNVHTAATQLTTTGPISKATPTADDWNPSSAASFDWRQALRPWVLISRICAGFESLRGSPHELWMAYVLKFLDSYSYFSFSIIFTLFMSNDFGFSDVQAGTIYGAWGALITMYGLMTGMVVDNFLLSLLARVCIFSTTSPYFLLFHIGFTLPLGNCLGIPVLTTGVRRYANETARGFAYGLFYVVMNVAALVSGPVVDMLTIWYTGEDADGEQGDGKGDASNAEKEWSMTKYRAIILTGIVANLIACIITCFIREIKVDIPVDDMPNSPGRIATFRPNGGTFQQILTETLSSSSFRRFLVVVLITLNVRMIFRHLDATLPKYMLREFGPTVPKGTIYSINPALIILLVPLVSAATTNVDPLVMIHYGAYVSAASVFFLVLSTSIWACVAFVTILSIGEAIWSPRLYDYTMSVCEEGREGTYMALSSAPLFLAKLPVGFLSGFLLQKYCPQEGERHSKVMWLLIGLLTASSPILLTVLWKYVSKRDESRDKTKYTELPGPTTHIHDV